MVADIHADGFFGNGVKADPLIKRTGVGGARKHGRGGLRRRRGKRGPSKLRGIYRVGIFRQNISRSFSWRRIQNIASLAKSQRSSRGSCERTEIVWVGGQQPSATFFHARHGRVKSAGRVAVIACQRGS